MVFRPVDAAEKFHRRPDICLSPYESLREKTGFERYLRPILSRQSIMER